MRIGRKATVLLTRRMLGEHGLIALRYRSRTRATQEGGLVLL